MGQDYAIGALWIGGALSFLEQLCLKSFVDAGHHVRLYTYGKVANIPEGIEVVDANDIHRIDSVIRHSRTGSPAPQADQFRYRMLAQCDRMIWADTDAYCLRPFTTRTGHFHGWESTTHVNNGVLGLPGDSETLAGLIAFTSDEFAIPEWLPPAEQDRLRAAAEAGEPVGVGDQQWGAWGPRALTHFLHKTGEVRHSLPVEALYPIGFRDRRVMLRPGSAAERFLTPETLSIHLYGRRMRARIAQAEGGEPHPDSLIGRLLKKHGIVPSDAPLPPPPEPDPVSRPLPAGARQGRGAVNLTDLADARGIDRGSARHRYTELYNMLLGPLRDRALTVVLLGLDGGPDPQAEGWAERAATTVGMWLEYLPKARVIAFDRAPKAPLKDHRFRYVPTDFTDPGAVAKALEAAPDVILDDAGLAAEEQQGHIVTLFPRLAEGGLYIVEDLRTAEVRAKGWPRTEELIAGYQATGVFDHVDETLRSRFGDLRGMLSGCFLFQAGFQKHRRDQVAVLHKR